MLDERQRRLEAFCLPVSEVPPRIDSRPESRADSRTELEIGALLADTQAAGEAQEAHEHEVAVGKLRLKVFDGDGIPYWLGPVGYLLLAGKYRNLQV